MIRVTQIKVPPEAGREILKKKAAKLLGIKESDIKKLYIVKQSIDARKKPEIFYSYTVDLELSLKAGLSQEKIIKRCKNGQAVIANDVPYVFPVGRPLKSRPVIVGMGPAGLFCGYFLAKYGYRPILLERGKDVEARTADVQAFWQTGKLNPSSNVQFGEGGAGTFSDGKLNTLIKDKDGRGREVLKIFVEHGAPEHILYDAKPHIGTDVLRKVVKSMREKILEFGGQVHFETKMLKLLFHEETENSKKHIKGVQVEEKGRIYEIPCEQVILAIGHSARDTFETLYKQKVPMEAKAFAVGMRVEHPQTMINESQYARTEAGALGAAPYKVAAKTGTGRGVYSFCMCPGGYVVNASSEEGRLAVNGMSYSDRGSANANSAIIVAVTPKDYGEDHPLAGVYFQRKLEQKAYDLGQGQIPVQRYGVFKACVEQGLSEEGLAEEERTVVVEKGFEPCTKGAYRYADLTKILPAECNRAFVEGMEQFGRMIQGFNRPDALLLGVESRTSSPVRIHRDEHLQSLIRGLFPCGEGAGYAGGITSAAMDGIRIAEEIAAGTDG